jgi:coenzyme F420-reducing hydrogenase gamma subunit
MGNLQHAVMYILQRKGPELDRELVEETRRHQRYPLEKAFHRFVVLHACNNFEQLEVCRRTYAAYCYSRSVRCAMCQKKKPDLLCCGKCMMERYCDRTCQREHWELSHKAPKCTKWEVEEGRGESGPAIGMDGTNFHLGFESCKNDFLRKIK